MKPNHTYYQSVHGSWLCALELKHFDWMQFKKMPLTAWERFMILNFFLLSRLPGTQWLKTSLDYHYSGPNRNKVLHTTQVTQWGLVLMKSSEVFRLHDNGQDVLIEGLQRFFPFYWQSKDYKNSHCRINLEGTKASYHLTWFGLPLDQSTEFKDGELEIRMDLGWAKTAQILRRQTK